MADEGLGDRSGCSKLALGEVSFRLAYDGKFHNASVVEILNLYLVQHRNLVRAELGCINDLGIGNKGLQFRYVQFKQALGLAGGLIFGIFGKVSLFARLSDCSRNGRSAGYCVRKLFF